jgi:CHRD domain-containing protein
VSHYRCLRRQPGATRRRLSSQLHLHCRAQQRPGDPGPKAHQQRPRNALLTLSTTTKLLCYSISYTDLVGTETEAHFHAPASAGQNADILFFISPPPNGPSQTGSPKTGCVGPLTDKQMITLGKGLFYLNVHSDTFPAGEIRGQVLPIIGAKTRGAVAKP